jgi:hypothetical protein
MIIIHQHIFLVIEMVKGDRSPENIHVTRTRLIFHAFGEALIQFFILAILIFSLERIGVFQINATYWDDTVIWDLEVGGALIIFMLLSLVLTNLLFVFLQGHWFYRGFVESLVFIGTYFAITTMMQGVITFSYSNMYLFILMMFLSVIFGNILINKFIPLN